MKQRIVVRVSMFNEKSRKKALKIAVSQSGVESVALRGTEMNQIEVVGDGIDAAELTNLLRKKVGSAGLVIVIPIDGHGSGGGSGSDQTTHDTINYYPATLQQPGNWPPSYTYPHHQQPHYYMDQSSDPSCYNTM